MRKSTLVPVLAVLVILGIFGGLYFRLYRGKSAEATTLPEGLGIAVAEESGKVMGNQGRVLLLLPVWRGIHDPLITAQRDALVKTLGRTKSLTILATETMEMERPGTMGEGALDVEQFRQFLQKYNQAEGIISLTGLPLLSKEAMAGLHGRKLMAVTNPGGQLKTLLQSGTLNVAIIPRRKPVDGGRKPANAREWFAFTYEVLTPAQADSLP